MVISGVEVLQEGGVETFCRLPHVNDLIRIKIRFHSFRLFTVSLVFLYLICLLNNDGETNAFVNTPRTVNSNRPIY